MTPLVSHHVMQPAPPVDGRKRWRCDGCGSTYTTPRPASSCPLVPLFRATEHGIDRAWKLAHEAGLYTRTQWKARQRVVVDGAVAAGVFETQRPSRFDLFAEAQTRPVKGSEAQLALGDLGSPLEGGPKGPPVCACGHTEQAHGRCGEKVLGCTIANCRCSEWRP